MKTRLLLVLLSSLAFAVPLRADELRLANGDRLTGTVVRLAEGILTFKTPNGELQVPWKDVTALTTDHPLLVRRTGAEPQLLALRVAGTPADLAGIVAIETPAPPVEWHGGASAGLLTTGGNTDVNSLRVDGEVTARTRHDRYLASALVNHAKNADVETARNWSTSFDYDRFLSKRLFVDGSLILANDRFRDLDLRTAVSGGVGYDAWNAPRGTLSVDGGFGYVRENFATSPDDDYAALKEAVKLDLLFLAKRLQVFHHHDGYFGVTGQDNLFFRAQNGVRVALVGGLVSTAEWDVNYDRRPSPGRVKTDRTFAFTFGYRF